MSAGRWLKGILLEQMDLLKARRLGAGQTLALKLRFLVNTSVLSFCWFLIAWTSCASFQYQCNTPPWVVKYRGKPKSCLSHTPTLLPHGTAAPRSHTKVMALELLTMEPRQ